MPRFYFDVHDGSDFIDELGIELASPLDARREAVRYAGNLIAEENWAALPNEPWRMVVRDDHAQVVLALVFGAIDASQGSFLNRNAAHPAFAASQH